MERTIRRMSAATDARNIYNKHKKLIKTRR